MGSLQNSFYAGRIPLCFYILIILIMIRSSVRATNNAFPETEPIGLDADQILLSLESPEQQQQQHMSHMDEKRSWQNLQGSWGKRDSSVSPSSLSSSSSAIDDYDTIHIPFIIGGDDGIDNEDISSLKYAILIHNNGQDQIFPNAQKRAWKAMNGAWGKRLSNGGDWNKFRGSWGKREPGWNNLKGLWGKRSNNWNKLQSAWGKRDLSNTPSIY